MIDRTIGYTRYTIGIPFDESAARPYNLEP